MAIQMGKALAFTAVGGLVAGLSACGPDKPADAAPAPSGEASAAPAAAKECCKGKNDCKQKGGCKTDANECKGKNECKQKGGCKSGECPAS
jgi:hypothetical protein